MRHHDDAPCYGSMVAGLLIGAAIGAAFALLYAPKPGREMRADLEGRLREARKRVEELSVQVADVTRTTLTEVRDDVGQAIEAGRAAAAAKSSDLLKQTGLVS